ncbi:hypothetical protein CQZ99_10495 [Pseudomonas poae]|uniref:Uncharacterized protein n=1 Tax=Pseudomonas poae TaxID=200451 RepID=A0A2S9EUU5_9PSED|nr:hypothetical protein CQZ99_10495 [Pseudomonas poae]
MLMNPLKVHEAPRDFYFLAIGESVTFMSKIKDNPIIRYDTAKETSDHFAALLKPPLLSTTLN